MRVHARRARGTGGFGFFVPPFYADFAVRSIFRTRLPCASASLADLARGIFKTAGASGGRAMHA